MILSRKEVLLKKLRSNLKWGILFAFIVDYGLVKLGIILKRYFGDYFFKSL